MTVSHRWAGHRYLLGAGLIPVAVEGFGAMAAQTHEAFTSFAKHMSEESSGAWRVGQCLAFLRLKLSVALHSASVSLLRGSSHSVCL